MQDSIGKQKDFGLALEWGSLAPLDGEVQSSCAKCHCDDGSSYLSSAGEIVAQPLFHGFKSSTCHSDLAIFTRHEVAEVAFPSGEVLDSGDPDTNLCMSRHQGRQLMVPVNDTITGVGAGKDEISEELSFRHVHWFAAGATRFGSEAQGAFEYVDYTVVSLLTS